LRDVIREIGSAIAVAEVLEALQAAGLVEHWDAFVRM
jgi:hypothetical protein